MKHIWKPKGISGKILFSLTRYLPFLYLPLCLFTDSLHEGVSPKTCSILISVIMWPAYLGIMVSEIILLLRTFALWGKNRTLLISLSIFLGCIGGVCIPMIIIYIRSRQYQTIPSPTSSSCSFTEDSKMKIIVLVLILLNETVIFIFTIWIGVNRYRHTMTPLVLVLYRDGVLYYAFIIGISCSYIFVMTTNPGIYHHLFFIFQCTMHNILTSRIILHTRDVAAGRGGSLISVIGTLEFGVFGDGQVSTLENS
ncbi:hypothetical protein BDZ94DRAFT_1269120 [Collybia nuda]|uniref:Uncharacterized protein n=1 Tax=Collybia nuda TaxID=64659 RepID=A0A9P5XYU5_9AGAR|nr:hypothetical protein BDZ94DRAFT_1269120 [Collybia nuda]